MFLRIRGYELEILQEKFVCFTQNDGETSHFSEWSHLGPKLQEKFKTIREQLLEVIENFIGSEHKAAFEAISEEYKKDQPEFGVPKS